MRASSRMIVALLLGACVSAQALPDADPVSDDLAKEAVKAFSAAYRSKDENERLAAVQALTRFRHAEIAKALGRTLGDTYEPVAVAGAQRLGLQDAKVAGPILRTTLGGIKEGNSRVRLQVALIEAMRRIEAVPRFEELKDRFNSSPLEVQREIIRAMVLHRDMKTVEWLAEHLDFPAPENKDDPTNPPADYWKGRVESWKFWILDLQKALHDLTGKDFEESSQVKEWRKKGGKIVPKDAKDKPKPGG